MFLEMKYYTNQAINWYMNKPLSTNIQNIDGNKTGKFDVWKCCWSRLGKLHSPENIGCWYRICSRPCRGRLIHRKYLIKAAKIFESVCLILNLETLRISSWTSPALIWSKILECINDVGGLVPSSFNFFKSITVFFLVSYQCFLLLKVS